MTTTRTQLNDQATNANFMMNEILSKETKAAFLSDFEEFAIDENMDQFNLDFFDDIDPLLN